MTGTADRNNARKALSNGRVYLLKNSVHDALHKAWRRFVPAIWCHVAPETGTKPEQKHSANAELVMLVIRPHKSRLRGVSFHQIALNRPGQLEQFWNSRRGAVKCRRSARTMGLAHSGLKRATRGLDWKRSGLSFCLRCATPMHSFGLRSGFACSPSTSALWWWCEVDER